MVVGISPDNLLDSARNTIILFKYPISKGIEPSKLLLDRSKPSEREEMLNISLGIRPVKPLMARLNENKFLRLPIMLGMLPVKAFDLRSNTFSAVRFPNVNGICPPNLLFSAERICRF
ncbi:hypothetical protein BS78_05G171200 [Paspalum vaginatum]|nr:hypothetical protein BS78_05G171200 [Paspalum vaginatum]